MKAIRLSAVVIATLFASQANGQEPPEARARFDAQIVALLGHSGGLTADHVAQRATATSLDIESKHEEVEAAEAGVRQAFIGFFPRLSGVASFTRNSSLGTETLGVVAAPIPGTATPGKPISENAPLIAVPLQFTIPDFQTIFRADLTVPISDYLLRLVQGYDAAKQTKDAAELTEKATALQVATDARIAYYTWVGAELQRVVAEASLEQAREHVADVKPAYEAGSASKADVLRFESQEASAELLVERATNASHVLMERLRVAMHDPSGTTYEVGESFPETPPEIAGMGTADDVFQAATGRRLEVRALEAQHGSLESQRQQATAGWFPRIDGLAEAMDANPNPRVFPPSQTYTATWAVGIQATWTVNDTFNAVESHKAVAAREAEIDAQRRAVLDGLRNEVFQAIQDVHETQVALQTSARGLAAAEESYRVRHSLFKAGRAIASELTDAEADLTRARLESLSARVNARVAGVRFAHAAGLDVK